MSNNTSESQSIQVKISDEILKGVYSNQVSVGHTGEEFVLDFMNIVPPVGSMVARVVLSPSHAKRLLNALSENIKNYEEQFGTISLAVVPEKKIGFKTE